MVQYHKRSKTKAGGTGGLKRIANDKRKAHVGGFFSRSHSAQEGEESFVSTSKKGGVSKTKVKTALYASVSDEKKTFKTKIKTVKKSPDNRHYSRENILTKGALIETDAGEARVTSRPGQHGTINAVLLKIEKK
ncbi:30S ribosomal protein S8e [Candidatus Micrarchaeota archaeon]|nr:30S ribosomal protein S8e [Candidatus Micrarchaeota archaeon]